MVSNTMTRPAEVPQTLAPGVSPDWDKLTFGLQDTAPVCSLLQNGYTPDIWITVPLLPYKANLRRFCL